MENLERKDFRYIVIESPTNVIEDINSIFENFIAFQQIKKKDSGQWNLSGIKDVLDHFFEIFSEDREKIYKKLNLDLVRELEFKFSFITNQGYDSYIKKFLVYLEKLQNNERAAEDEFQKLEYLRNGKEKKRFSDFLTCVKLIFQFYPSRNPNRTTDGVEEECLNRIEKRFKVNKIISSKVLSEILKKILKKSEGKTVKSRTFYRSDLKEVVMFYKTNENRNLRDDLPIDFEIVISCIEKYVEKIDEIIINSEYRKKDNKFDIPLKINISGTWYFFNLIDRKMTREHRSDINCLNDLINEESNILILLFRGNILNLNGLDVENYFTSFDKEKFKKWFEELIIDEI